MHTQPTTLPGFVNAEATPNAAITRPVTVGLSITQPSVIAERDVSYVMDCIRGGSFEKKDLRALITTIRGLGERQSGIAAGMKKSLPWFSGSTFHRRRGNEFFKAAWYMVFDLDHIGDIEGLKRSAIAKLPWLKYAFQSVRDGVKLLAEFASPVIREEDFRAIWRYLALQISHLLKVEVDSTPDPARACFLSYDPDLLVNRNCRPLDVKKTLREAEAIEMLTRAMNGSSTPRDGCDAPYSTPRDGAAGVPPAKTNGAAGVPPAMLPALNGKEQSPAHTGTCDAPSQNPLCVSPSPRLWVEKNATSPDDFEKASQIVQKLAQCVIPYSDWYRIGLALYAGFGEAGRQLWNLFLANPHYNDSQRDLDAKWNSFRNPREITLATLFEIGGRHGCL